MTFGPQTKRFKFYVRSNRPTDERPWQFMVHTDEKCARYRGSKATIIETTELGDTLPDAARTVVASHGGSGMARMCRRCLPPKQ